MLYFLDCYLFLIVCFIFNQFCTSKPSHFQSNKIRPLTYICVFSYLSSTPILINYYIQTVKVNCAFISMYMQSPNPWLLLTKNKTVLTRHNCTHLVRPPIKWTATMVALHKSRRQCFSWPMWRNNSKNTYYTRIAVIAGTIHTTTDRDRTVYRYCYCWFSFSSTFALPCYQYKEQIWKKSYNKNAQKYLIHYTVYILNRTLVEKVVLIQFMYILMFESVRSSHSIIGLYTVYRLLDWVRKIMQKFFSNRMSLRLVIFQKRVNYKKFNLLYPQIHEVTT